MCLQFGKNERSLVRHLASEMTTSNTHKLWERRGDQRDTKPTRTFFALSGRCFVSLTPRELVSSDRNVP